MRVKPSWIGVSAILEETQEKWYLFHLSIQRGQPSANQERVITRTKLASLLILDFLAFRTMRSKCCLDHPVCGLLQQPKLTKTGCFLIWVLRVLCTFHITSLLQTFLPRVWLVFHSNSVFVKEEVLILMTLLLLVFFFHSSFFWFCT